MPQYESLPGMYTYWVVDRALSMVGQGIYELGVGGRNPSNETPFALSKKGRPGKVYADCSGFTAWCLGHDRVQDLGEPTETWYSTDGMLADASAKPYLMYRKVSVNEKVHESDVIVYPSGNGRRYGHVGIITGISPEFKRLAEDWWTHVEVTHCTTGYASAVVTTNARLWAERGGYILRYVHLEG